MMEFMPCDSGFDSKFSPFCVAPGLRSHRLRAKFRPMSHAGIGIDASTKSNNTLFDAPVLECA
jgi:hypothetical protein